MNISLRIHIAGSLGESSVLNLFDEMAAIASVFERQRKSRDCKDFVEFREKYPTYAFALSDASPRAKLVMNATENEIITKEPMATAYRAVMHVLSGGKDYSNGAFFWDGYDFKTNKKHFKRKKGFKYTSSTHNIFSIPEERAKPAYIKRKSIKENGIVKTIVVAETDYIYESTAAFSGFYKKGEKEQLTGTIFWKMNPVYVRDFNNGKDYL